MEDQMNILIITNDVPNCFRKWLMYKIPKETIDKVVKNSYILLHGGVKYVFTQRTEKVRGLEVSSIITDEMSGPVNREALDESVCRFNYHNRK